MAEWMERTYMQKFKGGRRNGIAIKFYDIATQIKMALNFIRLIEKFKVSTLLPN